MELERPDLSNISMDVLLYIEALEEKMGSQRRSKRVQAPREEVPLEPSEPPTTINVVSISANGVAKRTPRHLYFRQRRGGMGIFDLDTPAQDPPAFLTTADEGDELILVTNLARVFRLQVSELPESDIRAKGTPVITNLSPRSSADERLAVVFPKKPNVAQGDNVILVSKRGHVRRLNTRYLGSNLQSGTILYEVKNQDFPAAACWSSGDKDLLITTRQGRAIRFSERQVPVRGCLGIRVDPSDEVVAVAAVSSEDGIFLLNNEGKGTIRLMSGFSANKAPGSGGKSIMKTDHLVGAVRVGIDEEHQSYDIFTISQLGKIIRFQATDVPLKEGTVQGVNCMSLRADQCTAMMSSICQRISPDENPEEVVPAIPVIAPLP